MPLNRGKTQISLEPLPRMIRKPEGFLLKSTLWVGGWTLYLVALWAIISEILQSNAGLELFDEVLYIAAASYGAEAATFYHQFPWAWHTRPLFLLVGNDVPTFRTLGGVALFTSAFLLGFGIERFSSRFMDTPTARGGASVLAVTTGLILGIASLTYYSGMLRAPSYNWVSLVGFLVALNGLLLMLSPKDREKVDSRPKAYRIAGSVALFSAGAFFTIPARPTTLLYLLAVSTLLVFMSAGRKALRVWIPANLASLVLLVGAAVGVGLWPKNAGSVLLQAATRERSSDFNYFRDCSIDNSTGLRGGFETLLCVPETFFSSLADRALSELIVFSALLLAVAFFRKTLIQNSVAQSLTIGAFSSFGFWIVASGSFPGLQYQPAQRWALMPEQVTGFLIIWAGALLMLARDPQRAGNLVQRSVIVLPGLGLIWMLRLDLIPERFVLISSWIALVGLLILLRGFWPGSLASNITGTTKRSPEKPELLFWISLSVAGAAFILGFGSSLGAYRIAPISTVLFVLAALIAVLARKKTFPGVFAISSIAVTSTLLSALVVVDGHKRPWNDEAYDTQTTITEITPEGSLLMLDGELSETLSRLTQVAEEQGWVPGTPLLSYTRWGLLLPLILGADVVPTLTLSLNWNPVESERNFKVASSDKFDFGSSWIGISRHENMSSSDQVLQQAMIQLGERYTLREFPEDYLLVGSSGGFELWKPQAGSSGM